MTTITLSLISHTNVGKTTLARTLLRRDVGEVLDQAHVTEVSEPHVLAATGEHELHLADTPGFGDSARLVRRLRHEGNPLGWFLHQVWDRVTDRALYCSQQAAEHVKESADVVLYLVNAAEPPAAAGYVRYELDMLAWIGKPVLVVLNQVGVDDADAPGGGARARRLEAWSGFVDEWDVVHGVVELDAFSRCWVEEGALLDRVTALLDPVRAAVMQELVRAWARRSLDEFERALELLGGYLARASTDREPVAGWRRPERRRATRVLADRLDRATDALMDELIALHGLEGRTERSIREHLDEDFDLPGEAAWSTPKAAFVGAMASGALGGLAADAMAGGLSFGGGAVAGALMGAMGGAGLVKGFRLVRADERPTVGWTRDLLLDLTRQAVLRYLAVAHFGRGRGGWRETGHPERWRTLVDEQLAVRGKDVTRAFEAAPEHAPEAWRDVVSPLVRDVLRTAYPHAANMLG